MRTLQILEESDFVEVKVKSWWTFSWRLGSVRGVEIRFHFSVLFSIVVAYFIFDPVDIMRASLALFWLVGFILSVLLHELAHALAARFVSVEVKNIVIWLLGGFTNLGRGPEKPLHRLAIYAAGPAVTFTLGLLFFVMYFLTPPGLSLFWEYVYTRLFLSLTGVNVVLFTFNILPVYPLDGGNILHSLMEFFFGKKHANLITMIVSIPVLIGLVWLGIRTRDYILLAFCVLIALAIGTLNGHTLHWITLGVNYIFKRGGYYFLQGDYAHAAEYYTHDIQREPRQVNHYIARFICYLWMMQREKARVDVELAMEIAPDNPIVLVMRGDLYSMDKDHDAALEVISRAKELKPDWAPAHMDHGIVLRDKGEYQLSLSDFDKAISLQADIPYFYVARSMAYFKLGNLEAMHEDQDLALQLSEKDALTRPEFNIHAYEGYLDWAEDYYARAIQARPRSFYAYQGRADAYRANKEFDKAVADYTRALEINPREPLLYLGRGKSHMEKGDKGFAAADFRQILALTNKLHLKHHAEVLLNSLAKNNDAHVEVQKSIVTDNVELE